MFAGSLQVGIISSANKLTTNNITAGQALAIPAGAALLLLLLLLSRRLLLVSRGLLLPAVPVLLLSRLVLLCSPAAQLPQYEARDSRAWCAAHSAGHTQKCMLCLVPTTVEPAAACP
jgi:hypothetical protein